MKNEQRDPYDLQRFVRAQETSFEEACREIERGQKSSHWMWYIFPQLKGLGKSSTAKHFGIKSRREGEEFFRHPLLGKRLKFITQAFLGIEDKSAEEILGFPDVLKMRSSMTLFDTVQTKTDLFAEVLLKYYDGQYCQKTREKLEED